MSRALSFAALGLALTLPACSELEDHYLGGEDLAPVDAGIFDVGTFPFDLEECQQLQDQLLQFTLPDDNPPQCEQNPLLLECPARDLLRQAYDCAGVIRQRFLDEANNR